MALVQCLDCSEFNLRDAGEMARQRSGVCGLDKTPGRYYPALHERHCRGFKQVDANTAQKRREWAQASLDKLEERFGGGGEKAK